MNNQLEEVIMENWRDLVTSYPDTPESKDYAKAIRTAEIILSEDLAHFETEWLAQTLLFKPIGLFEIITTKRASEDWLKAISDSFKILSKIVEKYWDVVENYYDDIIKLCMLSFDVQTRKEAILCLLCVVKHPSVDVDDQVVSRHISALEEAKTCKAPLAQLVGTICRYHPERVQEHFSRIWRIYLNMLQPNNKTDQVVNSVLQGINGLFEHFGDDIAMDQLNGFYDMISRECIKISKCLDVLLSILKHHARLFKERLAKDKALRLYLWQIETKSAMDALSNIYEVVLSEVENKQEIVSTELVPRIDFGSILIKHTALKIIMHARTSSVVMPSLCSGVDLEFQLRSKKLSYEEANIVSWCIGSSVTNSETMLLTAIMFYDNLPTSKKRDIVVNGILKASDDVRKAALVLLLKLCLQDNLDKYIDIWRVLLDNTTGPDLGKAVIIFEDALHHILEVLACCIEGPDKVYSEVRPIFSLMAVLLSLQKTEFHTADWCQAFKPTVVHLARLFGIDPVKMISETVENEIIYVEKFQEDTVLSNLLSTLTTTQVISHNDTVSALQAIFSKEDTDLKVLSKALSKMDVLMQTENNNLDKRQLSMIINQILRLKSKIVMDSKDARIFQKDVTMFLGKSGNLAYEETFSEDIYVMKLKNKITLNIPNIIEGTTYKIDLQRVFQLCLLWGDADALYSLLVILSANLCSRAEPGLQQATVRLLQALLGCSGDGLQVRVHPALLMCHTATSAQGIMKAITEELCPHVRRKLSDSLEILMTHDPGSETTSQLLNIVAEQAIFMISKDDLSAVVPGLDITRALLAALKDNNSLTVLHLSNILIYTSTIDKAAEIFEISSDIFIEKIDLFNDDQIKDTILKIIDKYATKDSGIDTNVNTILGFAKRVIDIKNYNPFIIEEILDMCKELTILSPQFLNLVTLLAFSNSTFELNTEVRKKIVEFNNGLILEELLKIRIKEKDDFKMNAVLVFLKEFADELKEMDLEKTLQCLGNVIQNIPPSSVFLLKNNLSTCLSIYKAIKKESPCFLTSSYEKWYKKLDLQNITEYIEEKKIFSEFSEDFSDIVHALKIMSELMGIPTFEAKNWTSILLENVSETELKWGRVFLTDLLGVSEQSLTVYEFEEILEGHLKFVKNYINVYFKRLIAKPFVNDDKCSLLIEIVDYFALNYKKEDFQNVLELIDSLWPKFQETSSFDEKQSVLLNLLRLPQSVSLDCQPVKWAITLLTTESTSLEDRIKIIATLPAGDKYSIYYRTFASYLPVRLSEMQGQYIAPFRALLDSLATNGDMTLLDIVITLAGGDHTIGWWDHAIDSCMTALAAKEDINIFDVAYKRTKSGVTLGVCNRIFLPLLRHSSRKFSEKYISTIVSDLFDILRTGYKGPSNNEAYRKRVVTYVISFNILKVAFEKISPESLESGILNESAGSCKPWYFMEQTCKYCLTVSANVKCPSDATDDIRDTCLWLQSSSYNCLTAAICRRKPNKKLYTHIFKAQAWEKIVDKDAVYPFDLQAYARYRGSKPVKCTADAIATSSSFTGTVRSRLFLTTLSENPLQYDMIPEEEDMDDEDDLAIEFEDSVLNAYGCLSTLTSLLEHASTLEHTDWRSTMVHVLISDVHMNVKWLVAQAICNAEEDLKPHGSILCPALFQLIADIPTTSNGKSVLNNLHIDIISTIIKWNITDITPNIHLDSTVEYLIYTCIENKYRGNIYKRLLNILNGILQLYGKIVTVKWDVFQDYCKDFPKDIISLLQIFERLLNNGVDIPELLATIFANLDVKQWTSTIKLAEICGLAFSLADSVTRDKYLVKFWPILNAVRGSNVNSYVKMLFYAQKNCYQCCDFHQFKIITDLALKVEKSKCLTILATYLEQCFTFDEFFTDMFQIISLSEQLEGEQRIEAMKIARHSLKFMADDVRGSMVEAVAVHCRNSARAVRKEAHCVILKAFQDLVRPENHHPSKRRAVDSSPILNTIDSSKSYDKLIMTRIFDGIFDADDQISKMVTDGVEESLSKDITMRFAELFYIIVYQSSMTNNDNLDLPRCGSKLLELLFCDLRSQEAFQVIRLRDEGLPQSVLKAYDAISSNTYTKTVLRSGVTYRQKNTKAPERREINVQMPVTDILDVFLQVSKMNSQVCQELCVQIMRCLQGTGRRFDLDAVISKLLLEIVKRQPNCLTPLLLDACRIFINGISSIPGFKESVEELKKKFFNSEGHLYTNILYEDLLLRSGDRNQFIFKMMKEDGDADAAMRNQEFSLPELIDVFGSLSNWDNLRLQERRHIEDNLPPLWTKDDNFVTSLREYFERANKKLDYGLWFNKMVASYYSEEVTQDRISWLKQTEKWPKRDFVTSAVIEAIQWHQNDGKIVGDITSSDCLAEWAARLMIRSAYNTQSSDSGSSERDSSVSRSHELAWCAEANNRSLPCLVLQCVDRNKECLLDIEVLPWVKEKVMAFRTIGLKENNSSSLQKALEAAEKQTIRFAPHSSLETNISMQKLILQLHHDLGSLSKTKIDDVMQEISTHLIREKGLFIQENGRMLSTNNAQVLKSIYELAINFYDEMWIEDDEQTQNEIISSMTDIIDQVLDYNLSQEHNLLFSVLLNRLAYFETTISDATAKSLLEQICRVFHNLDFFSIAILKKVRAVLPSNVSNKDYLDKINDVNLDFCKEYFQLICDANYALLQYCDNLRRNVLDDTEWDKTFKIMKNKLFENIHRGSDYQSLNTMKNKLYALENMAEIDPKAAELKAIIDELRSKPQRATLRLSQLCPHLCSPSTLDQKRSDLQRLLRLPSNVYVVNFFEQISVFTDSIRRPCVIKALLSNGTTRRYICKSGEPMYRDASVQRAAAILPFINSNLQVRSYNVTPLSDDSAIIEYLEDHIRLRDLMEEKHDINNIAVTRAGHEKLILAPSLALEQYNAMCDKVTPYILRSAIENNCSCVKEFIDKKRTFEDTLSSMTIINWLFGVGDRHLQNIMFSLRDGAVCGVDWASIFQYGAQELPPARLTANLLAVCDVKVLESRLQSMLICLRDSTKLFEAFVRTSFYWLASDVIQLKYINAILEGKTVSYAITRECLTDSNKKYKENYVGLLDNVFEDFTPKDTYKVEDQVSCLLQHCTEPRILSVTPQGWEAWL